MTANMQRIYIKIKNVARLCGHCVKSQSKARIRRKKEKKNCVFSFWLNLLWKHMLEGTCTRLSINLDSISIRIIICIHIVSEWNIWFSVVHHSGAIWWSKKLYTYMYSKWMHIVGDACHTIVRMYIVLPTYKSFRHSIPHRLTQTVSAPNHNSSLSIINRSYIGLKYLQKFYILTRNEYGIFATKIN